MRPVPKITLALVVGLVVAVALAFALHGRASAWRSGPGLALEFEPTVPGADLQKVRAIIERRFEDEQALVDIVGGHIQVWIPYPEDRQAARAKLLEAMIDLRKVEASPGKVEATMLLPPEERAAELTRLAPPGSAQDELLQKFAAATDALDAAQRLAATRPKDSPAAQQAIMEAHDALRKARIDFFRESLTGESLTRMLAAADDPANTAAVQARQDLPARYPPETTEILHARAAHDAWRAQGGGTALEPEDVQRLVESRGEIEFRIVVTLKEIESADLAAAADELWKRGPFKAVKTGGSAPIEAVWIEAVSGASWDPDLAAANFEGDLYFLCYADHDRTLTHRDPARDAWTLSADLPNVDSVSGSIQLPFKLDAQGAAYMAQLTQTFKGHPIAIIADGRVLSAPIIQSQIGSSAVIGWGIPTPMRPKTGMLKEATALQRAINAGPLPTGLRRVK